MRDHFQIVSQSNDLDAFGGVQQGHSKHGFMLVITLSMGLGAIATGVSHRLVTRPDIPKPVGQGGGTLYLNRFFSQPVYVDGLEYDPNTHDDPVRAFVDGIAQRVASVIGGSSSRFDIWLIGFKSGRGWPLLSKAPFAEVYIDEYLPNDNKLRHQYTFEAGGDGHSPVRLSGIAGNFVVWSLGCAGLVTLADRLVRSMLRRWSRPIHGFPIVPLPPTVQMRAAEARRGNWLKYLEARSVGQPHAASREEKRVAKGKTARFKKIDRGQFEFAG